MCFCAHASGNQIRTPTFQKSRPAFFKTTLSLTIDKKKFELRFASHFPLQFRKRESNRGCIAHRRIKKEEEEHASN